MDDTPKNVFSVDVEDYFHASALTDGVRKAGIDTLEHRVVPNTHRLLAILGDASVTGTFFVLGWVAERYPELIRDIQKAGHEIACHGYSHAVIYEQAEDEFRLETVKAKQLLEDITGEAVHGYRAASFSITKQSMWALEILHEAGFEYDSSVFPVRHDRYGIPDACPDPHVLQLRNGASLIEVPMTVARFAGANVPVSGGGYFRLYPYWFSRKAARRVNSAGRPWVFYVHPWEVDPGQPRLDVGALSRFRHYNNLDKTQDRLRQMLRDFEFGSMSSYLSQTGMLRLNSACDGNHAAAATDRQ